MNATEALLAKSTKSAHKEIKDSLSSVWRVQGCFGVDWGRVWGSTHCPTVKDVSDAAREGAVTVMKGRNCSHNNDYGVKVRATIVSDNAIDTTRPSSVCYLWTRESLLQEKTRLDQAEHAHHDHQDRFSRRAGEEECGSLRLLLLAKAIRSSSASGGDSLQAWAHALGAANIHASQN